ncbi:transcription initiation factor TFIID subunit 11 [Coemansia sp. RSA 988]|nr:transcription initiation factor TFIID subunit 11 [Coemansia sp. RSA 988]
MSEHQSQPPQRSISLGTSSLTQGGQSPATAKKRPRLNALTPAGSQRQRKTRGGTPTLGGLLSARKSAGSLRSGQQTPTKQRSGTGPSTHDPGESRSRRNSTLALPATPSHEGSALSTDRPSDVHSDAKEDDEPQPEESMSDDDQIGLIRQSKEEVREMWEQMSDEQRQRYGVYRRAALNKSAVKKLVSQVLNQQITSTLTFVIAGFSKVFIGEIVERAVQLQSDQGEEGPLSPEHLREAYRLHLKESPATEATTAVANGFTKRLF